MFKHKCKVCGEIYYNRMQKSEICSKKECYNFMARKKYNEKKQKCQCQNCGIIYYATQKQSKTKCKECVRKEGYIFKKQYIQNVICPSCKKIKETKIKNKTRNICSIQIGSLCEECKKEHKIINSKSLSLRMKLNNPSYTSCFQDLESYLKNKEEKEIKKIEKSKENKQKNVERMKTHNPMFNLETRKKVRNTLKLRKKTKEDVTKRKNYKGNRGIKRYLRIELKDWRKRALFEANYKCQLCEIENVFLHVHHVVPFSYIVEYYAKIHNFDLDTIKHKSEEYEILKNEVLNFHNNNSIALVVCENCHDKIDKSFHKQNNMNTEGIRKYNGKNEHI